jgi:hypothetical protein
MFLYDLESIYRYNAMKWACTDWIDLEWDASCWFFLIFVGFSTVFLFAKGFPDVWWNMWSIKEAFWWPEAVEAFQEAVGNYRSVLKVWRGLISDAEEKKDPKKLFESCRSVWKWALGVWFTQHSTCRWRQAGCVRRCEPSSSLQEVGVQSNMPDI